MSDNAVRRMMRTPKRKRRLQFEVMESRVVLSTGLAGAPLASTAWVGDTPAPTPPRPPLDQGVLAVSLTTDHSFYQLGQPVNITLTETNISSHDVTVECGPCIDAFFITQDGAAVWTSANKGPVPMYILVETLKPGQSLTLKATWNGMPNESTGGFEVHNALIPNGMPNERTGGFEVHNALIPNGPTTEFTVVGN